MKKSLPFRIWAPAVLLGAAVFVPVLPTRASAGQTVQSSTQALLDKAHALEARGRIDLAAQTWQQVLLTDPNNSEAIGGLARAAKSAGNLSLTNTYLERLRAINPNDPGIARVQQMNTQANNNAQLQQAGKLAKDGQYGQAMNIYRQIYGAAPPPGDIALAYYETESATEEGRPHAVAGLRILSEKYPGDSRYQVALGRILTYSPRTRAEGRKLLEQHPNDPQAVEALRQSLLWDAQNPATAGDIRTYLNQHSDETLSTVLRNEPRTTRSSPTAAQRAAAEVNATRSAEDQAAYGALNARRLDEAEAKFKAILANHPDDANALAGMGYIRMQQANFSGAISFLVQAKSDGSKDPGLEPALATSRFWYTMGEGSIALNKDDLPVAEKEYRLGLQMRPRSTEALEGLGGTLLKAQQFDAAIPVFTQFVKIQPSAPHAWRGLFLAEYGTGSGARALATDHAMPGKARAELAKDPLYLRALASAYSSAGRDADAERVLKGALDLPFPADATGVETETKLQYASLLQQANRLEQAGGLYRQVLAKEPNNIAAYQGLIRVEHAQGQDDKAVQIIEAMPGELYSKAMRDSGFDDTVASIYQEQSRLDVAQDILEKSIQQQAADGGKPSVAVQTQLAGIYLQRGNAPQAFGLYQQILGQHPDRLDAWKGLIDALHNTNRDTEALSQIQQMPLAVRTQLESDVTYLETVGAIYAALGQPQESQVFLRRVQAHYAAQHTAPPADVDVQEAWLLYNGKNDAGLYRQLMALGGRADLTDAQRRTVQTIWANWAVRRANQAAAAGNDRRAIAILNAAARSFPDNPAVIKALAGGYSRAGMPKQAVAIWKSMDLTTAPANDYKAAIGAALAANDEKNAETWLRFGLNQYPKDGGLLVLGAKFEQQRGDVTRAADYYRASLAAMPPSDPGAELASELSHPGPPAPLPGSMSGFGHGSADLSTLLAPGMDSQDVLTAPSQQAVPARPYLPGGADNVPVPYAGQRAYPAAGDSATPGSMESPGAEAAPSPGPGAKPGRAAKTRLRDYVPQATLDKVRPLAATQFPALAASLNLQEVFPLLSPAVYQHQQIVRLTEQASWSASPLTQQPVGLAVLILDGMEAMTQDAELGEGATLRLAGFYPPAQQAQQMAQPAPPLSTRPIGGQQSTGSGGEVYGPYVPYVSPTNKRLVSRQQTQVPQPAMNGPLTPRPAVQPAAQTAGSSTTEVVYGPYVPYVPSPKADVSVGNAQPPRMAPQPEMLNALPAARYVTNNKPKSGASTWPDSTASRAAVTRRKAAIDAAAATGQSRPPTEEYATPPIEPVPQYVATPAVKAPVYVQPKTQPAQYSSVATQTASQDGVPQQNGDSYGQQYPQPRTGTIPVHNRVPHRSKVVVSAAQQQTAAAPSPVLSYPGVGSTLGYQPYPVIGPAYPLPAAPSDYDLVQKQVPPLRGAYYTGPVLAPQVPLTERQQAERDLAILEASYSGWVGGTGSARYRSGVIGYDRLTDLETSFEASYVAGNNVRFSVIPKAVFLNSGQLSTTNYSQIAGSPVLGTLNTATAVNNPTQQSQNGVGGEFQITAPRFAVALGYTPYEFLVQNVTGRALFRPNHHFTVYFNRDSVVETQLSYAGLRDPGPGSATAVFPGNIWGGVVSTGGGVRFDMGDERAGFYITGDGAALNGYHVLDNSKVEGSMGAYFLAHTFPAYGRINVGVSMFGMHYAQNERPLSYGLGGYFSPDAYFLASVPVTFIGRYRNNFHYTIAGAVGVQTFQENSQLYFPLDRGIQTGFSTSCHAVTGASPTCQLYSPNSNTGGNYSINSEGAYRVADHWFAGGFLSANNTNNYNTVTAGFFVRYLFRPQIGTEDYPTGLFPVEGFRPLRVP